MQTSIEQRMLGSLQHKTNKGNLRILAPPTGTVDFSSNDYIGFARNPSMRRTLLKGIEEASPLRIGAGGSRLSSGNSQLAMDLEDKIAAFHGTESCLLFGSGYIANSGLISTIAKPGDICLCDSRIHMSIREGMRLSKATSVYWDHNSIESLEGKLSACPKHTQCFVLVESVYSCDGSLTPLGPIADLCATHGAELIVDEAHATGVFGKNGAGLTESLGNPACLLARIHTFGKALGSYGAAILGSSLLKSYLLNSCKSLIYTTMLPYPLLISINDAYNLLPNANGQREALHRLIAYFKAQAGSLADSLLPSCSPIQSLLLPKGKNARAAALEIQNGGYDVRPMTFPTVPKDHERIRICLHSFNTEGEIDGLVKILKRCL